MRPQGSFLTLYGALRLKIGHSDSLAAVKTPFPRLSLTLGMLGAAIGVFGGFRYLNDRINDVNTRVNTIYLSPSSKETNSTQDDSENAQINEPSS